MNFKKYHVSRNLFDGQLQQGYYTYYNGVYVLSDAYVCTHLIPCMENTTYTFRCINTGGGSRNYGYAFFDSSQNRIGDDYIDRFTEGDVVTHTATTPQNTAFLAINIAYGRRQANVIRPSDITDFMLNTGSIPLPYEPYSSEVWHDIPHYIMGTATDTFTTLPADLYADGNSATVGLKGNMSQTGTPSPSSPIQPSETGERTENLFDYSTIVPGYTYDGTNGQMILNPDEANRWRFAAVPLIEVESGATYRRTYNLSPWGNYINFYDSNKNFLEQVSPGSGVPVTVPSNCNFVSFVFQIGDFDVEKYMFTKGSTVPTHFEPYGYKIPISSASTTTPVYLGEVESTRNIRKVVFNGTENWEGADDTASKFLRNDISDYKKVRGVTCISTHYSGANNVFSGDPIPNNSVCFNLDSGIQAIYLKASEPITLADFKSYLAAQYAAGTPVCVWYVLASETTGIVNEPLMKIGDYADTVSGITIPTTTSKDTFDVDTTLKPSEVTVNYKGWHPVQSVHEYDSNYTIATMQALTIAQLQSYTIGDLEEGEWA